MLLQTLRCCFWACGSEISVNHCSAPQTWWTASQSPLPPHQTTVPGIKSPPPLPTKLLTQGRTGPQGEALSLDVVSCRCPSYQDVAGLGSLPEFAIFFLAPMKEAARLGRPSPTARAFQALLLCWL